MRNDLVWEVDAATLDLIYEYTRMVENAEISQLDYIDKLRSLGMPAEAQPGSNLRIALRMSRVFSNSPTRSLA
jgi:hypothetical protein